MFQSQTTTHSNVLVPLICAAMRIQHTAIGYVRDRFPDHFNGAVEEIRAVLPSFASASCQMITQSVSHPYNPYIEAHIQNAILDRVFDAFPTDASHLQAIQTIEAEAYANQVMHIRAQEEKLRRSNAHSAALRCCDAPGGLTCRVTGDLHVRIPPKCATCHQAMNAKQPFCGVQTGLVKCQAAEPAIKTTSTARARDPSPPTGDDIPLWKVPKY